MTDAVEPPIQCLRVSRNRRQSRAINTPDVREKKAAFAALSAAIEATATQLPDELYRQLYETGKGR